ncbi:MAG: helix-turn-helix domain-containing protein [Acidobacteriota bacterium]
MARWRRRFLDKGIAGLEKDAPRPGRAPIIPREAIAEIMRLTTQENQPTPRTGVCAAWRRRPASAT